MKIELMSKFNIGDTVRLKGPGGGIRATISSVEYNNGYVEFMYHLKEFKFLVGEHEICALINVDQP